MIYSLNFVETWAASTWVNPQHSLGNDFLGAIHRFSGLDSPVRAPRGPFTIPHRTTRGRWPHLPQVDGSAEPHEPDSSLGGAPDRRVNMCRLLCELRTCWKASGSWEGRESRTPQGAPSPAATKSPAPQALRRPPLRILGAADAPRA